MYSFEDIKQRITIQDILNDFGYNPPRSRMACPIHGGNNPTAFSFNDETFHCFSCGAKGGLIDLVQHFQCRDRETALHYLESRTGISISHMETPSIKSKLRRKPPRRSAKLEGLKSDLYAVEAIRESYIRLTRMFYCAMRQGEVSLAQYYAKTQYFEYELEYWDSVLIKMIYKIHQIRKVRDKENKKWQYRSI